MAYRPSLNIIEIIHLEVMLEMEIRRQQEIAESVHLGRVTRDEARQHFAEDQAILTKLERIHSR